MSINSNYHLSRSSQTIKTIDDRTYEISAEVNQLQQKVNDLTEEMRDLSVFCNECLKYLVDQHKPKQIPGFNDLYHAIETNNRALFDETLKQYTELSKHLYKGQISIEFDTAPSHTAVKYNASIENREIIDALYTLMQSRTGDSSEYGDLPDSKNEKTVSYNADDIVFYIKRLIECDPRIIGSSLSLNEALHVYNKDHTFNKEVLKTVFDYLVSQKHIFKHRELASMLCEFYYFRGDVEACSLAFKYALKLAVDPSQFLDSPIWDQQKYGEPDDTYYTWDFCTKFFVDFIFDHIDTLKQSIPELGSLEDAPGEVSYEEKMEKRIALLKSWIFSYIVANNKK